MTALSCIKYRNLTPNPFPIREGEKSKFVLHLKDNRNLTPNPFPIREGEKSKFVLHPIGLFNYCIGNFVFVTSETDFFDCCTFRGKFCIKNHNYLVKR